MKASEVWCVGKGLHQLRLGLLLGALVVGLSGCEGKGCFGLCDERDDIDDDPIETPDPDPGLDLSCYIEDSLEQLPEFSYALDNEGDPIAESNSGQLLRFYRVRASSSTDLRPVLVWVTGDTWELNTDTNDFPSLALNIARRLGVHFAAVSYRQSDTAAWPAQIVDVKSAIRVLREQSASLDYNIDTDQVYIGGDQAGATLAALAALADSVEEFNPDVLTGQVDDIALLITLGGMHDFRSILADNDARPASCAAIEPRIDAEAVTDLFNCDTAPEGADPLVNCDSNELSTASPVRWVSAAPTPTLTYHGALDCQVPVAQSEGFDAAFGAADADTELRGLGLFTSPQNDTAALETITADMVLEDLVGLRGFNCDDS